MSAVTFTHNARYVRVSWDDPHDSYSGLSLLVWPDKVDGDRRRWRAKLSGAVAFMCTHSRPHPQLVAVDAEPVWDDELFAAVYEHDVLAADNAAERLLEQAGLWPAPFPCDDPQ